MRTRFIVNIIFQKNFCPFLKDNSSNTELCVFQKAINETMKRPRSRTNSFMSGAGSPQSREYSAQTSLLRPQFELFALFGSDRHKDGSHITLSQIDRWLRQAGILDGKIITTTDTAILFKRVSL